MSVVILGCGRVGARLACAMCTSHRVTVIDWDRKAFERLGRQFGGETVLGNGIDVDVLGDAGIREAHLFVALTDGDNRNLMAAQIADHFGVPKVLARVYDAERSQIFSQMGLTTVSPTIIGAERLFRMVTAGEESQ